MSAVIIENTMTGTTSDTATNSSSPSGESIKLSASRIKTYLTCPRQFRYRYVDGLPTVLTGALAFGKVIHQVIHDLHQWSIYSNEPLHEEIALSNFARLWEQTIDEQKPEFKSDDEMIEYAKLAELILFGYIEAHRDKAQPFLMEFPFEIELHDEHYGHNYSLRGIIDRIDQTDDGLIVVDFKSGKRKPSLRDLAGDVQFSVYAFASGYIFGQEVRELVLYHLRDQTSLVTSRKPEQIRQLTNSLMPHVVRGIADSKFAPHLGYWCNFCEFKARCLAEGPDEPATYFR